ncbi:ribonuclease T [Pseudochrobactrum sp. sp1633]|uniref:ribonuclease T2 family protein n=1 Tax=Pseudochrobactrum sp. sp1633 TaxID=3036706 RepID=UPI0025A589CF|nr:ribonuclease T [Pseudochrobactrum sp. sp1633]MDM8346205.1 ribonuclease T [Pseudochrobactrum sp. sp1633]HWD13730.1 ribonuclease T [Pseudochrobactrum sp.]
MTGCFSASAILLVLTCAFTSPVNAQPLNEKLLQGMGNDLRKLSPLGNQERPALRPENKIPQRAPVKPQNTPAPSVPSANANFDFYVLSLSWSPSYCADNGNRANARQQCGTGRSYGFIVHGLWPQYDRGFPESCDHRQANDLVPRDLVSELSDIMPSAGLMRHEWRKHGTCAGISQRDYFSTVQNAYQAVTVPPALRNVTSPRTVDPQLIEKAFIAANPGLPADAIAVTCNRRRIQEVRICMDKGLKFRSCGEVDRNSCRSRSVTLLPNR